MRFTIKREEFLKGLTTAARAIPGKSPVASLNNFKIVLNEEGMYITGSNYDLTIQTYIPYKKGEIELIRNCKEGAVLINAKLLNEIARKMDSDELIFEVIDSTIACVRNSTSSEYEINCMRVEEYPDIDLQPVGTEVTLPTADFRLMVEQTAFAASNKEQRPVFTAVNLEACDGVLTATATDSARLARKTLHVREDVAFAANVPAKTLVEVSHLVADYSNVSISFSPQKALFAFGGTLVATRLITGDYLNTRNVVPTITNYLLEVNAQDLVKAIDRANILSLDVENAVCLTASADGVEISAKSSQVGSATEKLGISRFEGGELKICFNSEFVCSAVKALGSQDVVFLFVSEKKPFIIKNTSDDSIIQLVTPMRI